MRKIILYIASSLDGYIADFNHGLKWLTIYKGNYGYEDFLSDVDTVISGRKTYDEVVKMGVPDPYSGKDYFVLTRSPSKFTSVSSRIFTEQNPVELANKLKNSDGKNIFLVGGGNVIAEFLEHDLIDEIILFVVPIILGSGIPLFNNISHSVQFSTASTKRYDDGMVELRFIKK